MVRALTLLLLPGALVGCNQYDLFRLSGFQQESFSNKADILFVVDNSDSMTDEAAALAVNFTQFISRLETQEEEIVREDLTDAVDNYKDYVLDRGAFVDFQIGITTTDVEDGGFGELKGAPGQTLLSRGDPDLADKFLENLLCHATCFRASSPVGDDPSYQCGQPLGGEVTTQYLDCICGEGEWLDVNCAQTGCEEGLEATFMAMCRAVPNPPEECFAPAPLECPHNLENLGSLLERSDVGSNAGLLRPNATLIPVMVTDEGDDSRRELSGDPFPDHYDELFPTFSNRMSWVVIGPPLDDAFEAPIGCTGYSEWGAFRYDYMVRVTAGLKLNIAEPDASGGCPNTDFGANLDQFGDLLKNLLTVFELQSVPDPNSILVFVDGARVPEASVERVDDYGLPIYGTGWSYAADINAIQFHGAAVPPNDANVRVYYDPIDGMPRDLPF